MNTRTAKTKRLIESAVMLAIATVLSELALVKLPYGGSVTLASMLPVLLIAYRYGTPWGLACGFCYGIVQQLVGLSTLSYFTTWQSIVAIILLDYLVAFALIGVGGLFRRTGLSQSTALAVGALAACVLRYACHVISGATVWAGLSIPTEAALVYSFAYNATYMLPETLVTVLVAAYIGRVIDFSAPELRRMTRGEETPRGGLLALASVLLVGTAVFDVVSIAAHLQNAKTGEFDFAGLVAAPFGEVWLPVIIVSAVALLAAVPLLVTAYRMRQKH